ncbi:hypothetical protein BJV85_002394 [Clostridium acetobutylicum]|uniref:Predicted diverged CheY-domain n=1 Tax=Clostridium acetobutylicum (strain ATCC 824 / DSM 792 / JCM 1419 / IAM 19013 / LMG 5710 / NBRC 13948 / NRRL B-527 / VKM B-1787 / 2291 / W) TaxID=272562 RepID=Q97IN8_CLOAB|nr:MULTISPECIES: DUF2325 domain-containing protein [Clostridium]AAK79569.1 Predicted diverged CheY-domain [Clostridium acetobutylicum ATCC 824]ADZ20654.1 diverged CheY-domain protein [Clostridium acetobutylicum EA 2018]AEI31887.1 diverged CheY-domain-containing protein [Clostridium acetobutylicum DSM 1731]AWV79991.1 DUF2325 domain-containing protein [Clostridium acetobutylicum]KHD34470.1 dihydroorotate dehydrogenase [Clostridium acetobutylicum]
MSVLLIGGDKLGNIKDKLKENGFSKIEHVTGRKSGNKKIKINSNLDLVLVLVDFVGHNLVDIIKRESKKSGVAVKFSRRSWVYMEDQLQGYIQEIVDNKNKMA